MKFEEIFKNLGIAGGMAELATLVLVLAGLSIIFWFLIGRFRLHNFLINMYISYALVNVLPHDLMVKLQYSQILFFLISVVLLTLLNRYIFDIHQSGSGLAIWQVIVMSFLELVLLLSIIFSYLPEKELLKFMTKNSLSYFVQPWWKVAWMAMPLAFLVFVKRRDR